MYVYWNQKNTYTTICGEERYPLEICSDVSLSYIPYSYSFDNDSKSSDDILYGWVLDKIQLQ